MSEFADGSSFYIDGGGRKLFGRMAGRGSPPVILDAGLGDTSDTWAKVQPAVAAFSSVISYDRAGLGRSDPGPVPRTCQDMVGDLRKLLNAANLPPPYLLVAHSWSGMNARWFASQYPDEVAGMVLVDCPHEHRYTQFSKVISAERCARMWAGVLDPAQNDERIDRMACIAQVCSDRPLFNFPLVVLTRAAEGESPDVLDTIERDLQSDFLNLSIDSRQFVAKSNDHFIQNSEPGLVIAAIRLVLEAAQKLPTTSHLVIREIKM